jgi:arsenate reductase-like glutaredoxin family protein
MFQLGKNEIKFLYNSKKSGDKEAYAYALTLHKHVINELDVSKNDITPTQFSELADKLNIRIIDLFDKDSDYFKENIKGKDIVESDLLTLLAKEKHLLKTPILISKDMVKVLEYPRDTIQMDMDFNQIKFTGEAEQ